MRSEDLEFYEQYLSLIASGEGIRVILSCPDDYIALLRENERLRQRQKDYDLIVSKWGMELTRALNAEDKLHILRQYLDDNGIIIPHFKW